MSKLKTIQLRTISTKLFFIATLLATGSACSSENFTSSLAEYCQLFSENSINSYGRDLELQAIYGEILERQASIKNETLQKILNSADTTSFASFHASVTKQIEAELGNKWQCSDFDSFFLPAQKIITLQLGGITQKAINPESDNVITIMLTHSGETLINNKPLTSINKLSQAITLKIYKQPIDNFEFVIYFDQGSNGELIADILAALSELGVSKVGLIDM